MLARSPVSVCSSVSLCQFIVKLFQFPGLSVAVGRDCGLRCRRQLVGLTSLYASLCKLPGRDRWDQVG